MERITASELAGLGVGALLTCAALAAPKVDAFISASQRSSLGLCKKCGGLRMIACVRCRGTGLVPGGPFRITLVDDLFDWFGDGEVRAGSVKCTNCQGTGSFRCPDCSVP